MAAKVLRIPLGTCSLDEIKARAIDEHLVHFDGDKIQVAACLRIGLKTIYNHLDRKKASPHSRR
jgi:DNA-binding NtrC family response regulator